MTNGKGRRLKIQPAESNSKIRKLEKQAKADAVTIKRLETGLQKSSSSLQETLSFIDVVLDHIELDDVCADSMIMIVEGKET